MCASLASIFLATTFAINTMPETAHDDTEVVTNHSFTAKSRGSVWYYIARRLDKAVIFGVERLPRIGV